MFEVRIGRHATGLGRTKRSVRAGAFLPAMWLLVQKTPAPGWPQSCSCTQLRWGSVYSPQADTAHPFWADGAQNKIPVRSREPHKEPRAPPQPLGVSCFYFLSFKVSS